MSSEDAIFACDEDLLREEDNEDDFKLISGIGKSYVLDTAALLGGNEYLISQMLEKLEQTAYITEESECVRWACRNGLGPWGYKEMLDLLDTWGSNLSQAHLSRLFSDYHRERLPRMVAFALLYSGRYEDTQVLHGRKDARQGAIVLNMENYQQVELPLNAKGLPACRRLALLYLRNADFPESIAELDQEEVTKPRPAARKISQSLAHEKKMLSLVNVFAILPAP